MSQSKQKAIRMGYKQAGAIYWTKDMETIIRKIQRDKIIWMTGCLLALVADAFLMLKNHGLF